MLVNTDDYVSTLQRMKAGSACFHEGFWRLEEDSIGNSSGLKERYEYSGVQIVRFALIACALFHF